MGEKTVECLVESLIFFFKKKSETNKLFFPGTVWHGEETLKVGKNEKNQFKKGRFVCWTIATRIS